MGEMLMWEEVSEVATEMRGNVLICWSVAEFEWTLMKIPHECTDSHPRKTPKA